MGESVNKITIVSGLFYIGRDRWKNSAFPPGVDRYKSWVTNLLSLDINLYFYTDDFYYDFILENRKKYDPELEKTQLIRTSLEDFQSYKTHYANEACLMSSPEFKASVFFKDSADMNYPLYHIVNFSKIEMVKKSSEEDRFKSNYFFWVDAGGLRESPSNYENVTWPNLENKIFSLDKVTHFSHSEVFNIHPTKKEYFLSQVRNIQGTAWVVPKNLIPLFYNMINNEVTSTLKNGIIGSDEKIYDSLHNNRKELYNLKQGGWFSFFELCK
jgi:hypothetical protein